MRMGGLYHSSKEWRCLPVPTSYSDRNIIHLGSRVSRCFPYYNPISNFLPWKCGSLQATGTIQIFINRGSVHCRRSKQNHFVFPFITVGNAKDCLTCWNSKMRLNDLSSDLGCSLKYKTSFPGFQRSMRTQGRCPVPISRCWTFIFYSIQKIMQSNLLTNGADR